MALQKIFEDERGVIYPESYWRITSININIDERTASFIFTGYKDATARQVKKSPISNRFYSINGDNFDANWIDEEARNRNIRTIMYEWAKNFKDIPTGEWGVENEHTSNVRSVQIMKSFFNGALDV